MTMLLWLSLAILFYVYAGYPLILQAIVWARGARPIRRGDALPAVSFVISAYNEAGVIAAKLENALALDYPADKLQIVVISDASGDGTDAIVRRFAPRVELVRLPARRGKTAGLNQVVPGLRGDIVVFSDANAMYQSAALRMLVRNFADPDVGCVTGEARYTPRDRSAADAGERVYWDYEIWIKGLESAVGSMVGGDGAIYAIRRELWSALPENAINDFLNPLQIVSAGFRGVYEPEAVCYEETAGRVGVEWRRRVRIVSRSWRAVFQAPGVLNPARVGVFAFCLFSHKVLRWFSAVFVAGTALGAIAAVGARGAYIRGWQTVALALVTAAVVAIVPKTRRGVAFLMYFVAITFASLGGILKGSFGSVSGVWSTPRSVAREHYLRPGVLVLAAAGVGFPASIVLLLVHGTRAAPFVFWASIAVLVYVYAGYPLLISIVSRVAADPVRTRSVHPRVCLLIAAYNEETVIENKLRNSVRLDYPPDLLEIVVASDGSTDGTNAIAGAFPDSRVRLMAFPARRGKTSAIVDAMQAVSADVVVFSDANTFLKTDAIQMLVRNFGDERVGAVSGDVVLTGERAALGGSEDLYYRYERALQRNESSVGSLIGVDGALYAIRRALFVAPPGDTILDDMAIPMAVVRAGYRVVFEEQALAFEEGSASAQEEFSRKSRVIAGAVQFLVRRDSAVRARVVQPLLTLVSHKALRWLSPAFAAVAFAAALVMARESVVLGVFAGAQLALCAGGLAGCIPRLRRIPFIGLAHYVCLVQSAAAFGFLRGLLRRQPVAWRRFARAHVEPV